MAATTKPTLSGFARALIQHGHLQEADALACSAHAGEATNAFMLDVANRGLMSCAAMARFAAETFGYPLLDIAAFDPAMFAREAVDRKLLAKHQVAPLAKRQNRITLATADPSNLRALDEIRFQTGMQLDLVIAEADKLKRVVDTLSESAADTLKELTGEAFDMDMLQQDSPTQQRDEDEANEVDDAPVVKFIQKVLIDAINEGASDVHFEPYEKYYRIRVRTDGILRDISQPPLVLKDKIAARIKVISRLDISEKRVPQDGRMKLVLSKNKAIDFRVSTLPTLHGEKIVMRILDPSSAMLGIDALGYDPDQKEALVNAIKRPYGMVLVTGPTGSGKSTTLAAMVDWRNEKSHDHIVTVEDPVEFVHQHGRSLITQREVGIDTESFDVALKSSLRQAPDVILIGEIRSSETMEFALQFAETGHLCLATLHANNANQALDRILHLVPQEKHRQFLFDLSFNLRAIVAQQLLPSVDGRRRFAAFEVLLNTPLITDIIRKGEMHRLKEVMTKSGELGMQTFDQALFTLFCADQIGYSEALAHADSANDLRLLIKLSGREQLGAGTLDNVTLDE